MKRAGVMRASPIFVARPFNDEGQDVFERVIEPALDAAGLEWRHLVHVHDESVIEHVCAAIDAASGVLAVLAGRSRNVYLETGIAIAMRKPILIIAETEQDCGMLLHRYPVAILSQAKHIESGLSLLKRSVCRDDGNEMLMNA